MRPLLEHGEGEVRARACNLIGNLCRYNTAFYEAISGAGLIEVLIDRCRDFDRSTRKFACFAIGNAGAPPSAASMPFPSPAGRQRPACAADINVHQCIMLHAHRHNYTTGWVTLRTLTCAWLLHSVAHRSGSSCIVQRAEVR